MDIREAITHARQVADGCAADNRACAYQHDQLVGWLEELEAFRAAMPLERAQELALAEQAGRLVVLLCKVRDTVYRIWKAEGRAPFIIEHHMANLLMIVGWMSRFGKDVFLTRKEAEEAMKVSGGGGEET